MRLRPTAASAIFGAMTAGSALAIVIRETGCLVKLQRAHGRSRTQTSLAFAAAPALWTRAPRTAYDAACGARRVTPLGGWVGSLHMASTTTDSGTRAVVAGQGASEEEWTTARVRQTFIDYFVEHHGHTFYPSSPSVPLNDPTLLFANAGMNQFKPIFLGQADPRGPLAPLKRVVNSQKCIRAGGKHNDLEDVGRDTYHHTFFEMLGTWSFGDYFKDEAIAWAWDLLTVAYGLPADRLYATYFGGDTDMGVPPDTEARDFWLRFLPPGRVLPGSRKDNFWEMGDQGPCGPCSELHFDRIGGRDAASLVNQDDPDVLEIWNLVFIQFNRREGGDLAPLPARHVDTGMGLERLVSVLQRRRSNYDTDAFAPLFAAAQRATGAAPYGGRVAGAASPAGDTVGGSTGSGCDAKAEEAATLVDTAYRVVADHARTLAVAIADGATPSNEGRGYVLRRILRRAVRYGQQILGAKEGLMTALVPVAAATLAPAFPEVGKGASAAAHVIAEEECGFSVMLERGIKLFNELESELRVKGDTTVSGAQAFYLYDTLGFPVDLTKLMASEVGLAVDMAGFEAELAAQKARSKEAARARRAGGGGGAGGAVLVLEAAETARLAADGIRLTNDGDKYVWHRKPAAVVKAIFDGDAFVAEAAAETTAAGGGGNRPDVPRVGLVLDRTAFYAEAGGQVADVGELVLPGGARFVVEDVRDYGGYVLHVGFVRGTDGTSAAKVAVGDAVACEVDYGRRGGVAPNHTMTHVLNHALRAVLGPAVDQRGSLVSEEKLRFDFSHPRAVDAQDLAKVEARVRACVQEARPVYSKVVPLEVARAISGLRAVFGEAYPDPVRVVSVGVPIEDMLAAPDAKGWAASSVEFCGGTHLSNTAEAGDFVLTEETAVAKGVRRITAVTGPAAAAAAVAGMAMVAAVAALEASPITADDDIFAAEGRASTLRTELDAATVSAPLKTELRGRLEAVQKRTGAARKAMAAREADRGVATAREAATTAAAAGEAAVVMRVDIGSDSKAVPRTLAAVTAVAPALRFLGLSPERADGTGKLLAFALVPEGKGDGATADAWLRAALEPCGGRGGGKGTAAQGTAPDAAGIGEAMAAAKAFADANFR